MTTTAKPSQPKPPPAKLAPIAAYERNHHQVECPRYGTRQVVKARVGIHTDFIRFLCKNNDCAGAFHMYPLSPSVRAAGYYSKLANQRADVNEDTPDFDNTANKPTRRGPKRKPKPEGKAK